MNRNADVAWGTRGSSDNPCSETYQGKSPFSEPSLIAWKAGMDFVSKQVGNQFKAYIAMHNWAQMIISAYAVSEEVFPSPPTTIDKMNEAGRAIAEAMSAVNGAIYQYGQTRDVLYPSSGTSKDWVVQQYNVPLSWTWELRDEGELGYLIPAKLILPISNEVKAGFKALLQFILTEL